MKRIIILAVVVAFGGLMYAYGARADRLILNLNIGANTHTITSGQSGSFITGGSFVYPTGVTGVVKIDLIYTGSITNNIYSQTMSGDTNANFIPENAFAYPLFAGRTADVIRVTGPATTNAHFIAPLLNR